MFPSDAADYDALRDSLQKLKLNDAALQFEPENSLAMGFGFRSGPAVPPPRVLDAGILCGAERLALGHESYALDFRPYTLHPIPYIGA